MSFFNAKNYPDFLTVCSVPMGAEAYVLSQAVKKTPQIIHIAENEQRLNELVETLTFFTGPSVRILPFPGWDCLPYDRVSPHASTLSMRIETLCALSVPSDQPTIIVATVNSFLQKIPKSHFFAQSIRHIKVGDHLSTHEFSLSLVKQGYHRSDVVRERGEFSIRGDIVDLFPMTDENPVRLDLFGTEIEKMRRFDALSQMTIEQVDQMTLLPANEFLFDDESIGRFKQKYKELFGTHAVNDPLYEAVNEKRLFAGMEHWLPLFHQELSHITDYLESARLSYGGDVHDIMQSRFDLILEYHQARLDVTDVKSHEAYRPLAPNALYSEPEEIDRLMTSKPVFKLYGYELPEAEGVLSANLKLAPTFAAERVNRESFLDDLIDKIHASLAAGTKVVISAFSEGSKVRLEKMLNEKNLTVKEISTIADARQKDTPYLTQLQMETGFSSDKLLLITENDIFGERIVGAVKRRRRSDLIIEEASHMGRGDLVVHMEHGIGRYDGLETVQVGTGEVHDCVRLLYLNDDKLFVPVENIDVLSRHSGEGEYHLLDKLGGTAWQMRKAKAKEKIRQIAEDLIKVAAQRETKKGEVVEVAPGAYDEFCARFPYAETEDQLKTISDTLADMASGKPMDRLVCGDVGFGKTEVALRAAFVAAMSGKQVAVVAPTTLLARQHFEGFMKRFKGFPINLGRLSRLVSAKEASATKEGLKDGSIDIVVGTHAVLAKTVDFDRLGLVVIDEEQRFGVKQKERLKELKSTVHVLTLTATPIPRTMQQALSGVKEMSIIATPPVNRLAIRTFVLPYDPVVVKEAILREYNRGGQVFYVCPRIQDLTLLTERIQKLTPNLKIAVAHGQMAGSELEKVMTAFLNRQADILISTHIVESGLDIPSVNTILIHRADRFGLAQLYQLRGRVGRSKSQAYAYLTTSPNTPLSDQARKRLDVMGTLDSLGAGFSIASHDMDIRGAGNILGEEQSGHIKEVGVALYQHMLEEAIANAKGNIEDIQDDFSPVINIGISIMIPEDYIQSLDLRLSFYQRIAGLKTMEQLDGTAAEMIDRFGPIPNEVNNLLEIVMIKNFCRISNIEKLDGGPMGAVITFRNNSFPNPEKLITFIGSQAGTVKLRPDHKLVVTRAWGTVEKRLSGAKDLTKELAEMCC